MLENEEKFLRLADVVKITGLAKPTIYRMAAQGKFPESIKIGPRASAWLESEVKQWMQDKVDAAREWQIIETN